MTPRFLIFTLILTAHAAANAQGALEPLAPPGPTMKTLDEVEPRIPVSEAMVLNQPGSYYLTNDITGRISISTENVSFDLNGFTITPDSGTAVLVNSSDKIRIFNGTIAGGEGSGIAGSGMGSVSVSDMQLFDITGDCIELNNTTGRVLIERVHCHTATRGGIFMRQSVDDRALHAVIRDNVISNVNTATNLSTYGIAISHNTTGELHVVVSDNRVLNGRVFGLLVQGPEATASGQVTGNLASGNGGPGIMVFSDVLVANNMSASNGTNYNVTSQQAAPITSLDQNPGPWDNISE